MGDVPKGLMIGAQMQLMWMGATAIGPTAGLDIGTGGTIGAAVALATNSGVESAIMFGVPVSVIMQFGNTLFMAAYSGAMAMADKAVDELKFHRLTAIHFGCTILQETMYFCLTFVLMYFGAGVIDSIVNNLPEWVSNGLNGVAALLPALGFALLMKIIMNGSLWPFFILGFVPAAFVGFDINMVGMAAIAVAVALIIYQIKVGQGRTPQPVVSTATASTIASDDEWED